jgi:hypothetical protein
LAKLRTLRAERDQLKIGMARSNTRIQALTAANRTIAAERDRLREALTASEE